MPRKNLSTDTERVTPFPVDGKKKTPECGKQRSKEPKEVIVNKLKQEVQLCVHVCECVPMGRWRLCSGKIVYREMRSDIIEFTFF